MDDDYTAFAQLLRDSDVSASLDDTDSGLLTQYQNYCKANADSQQSIWTVEANTWVLVRELLSHRNQAMIPDEIEDKMFMSDRKLINIALASHSYFNENLIVKEWLQGTAPSFECCEVQSDPLKYTKELIKKGRANDSLVTALDPDAQSRERKVLASQDMEYQLQLNQTIFMFIRRGDLESAIEICLDSNQPLRAASLQGGVTFSDPAIDDDIEDGEEEGNPNLDIWKAICFAQSQDDIFDAYERATYGALSGDFKSVAAVCVTWEDFLWAHFNALLESRIHKYLTLHTISFTEPEIVDLPLPVYDFHSEKQIFENLQVQANTQAAARENFHLFQMYVILDSLDTLFEKFKYKLDQPMDISMCHSLRFATHLILILRALGYTLNADTTNLIIEKYIGLLKGEEKYDLISLYYSHLPKEAQRTGYSIFLSGMDSKKSSYYMLGLEYALEMAEIARMTVTLIFQNGGVFDGYSHNCPTVEFVPFDAPISASDKVLAAGLDWLAVKDTQINDLLSFRHGRINSARAILHSLPNSSETEEDNEVEELSQYRALVGCFEKYDSWALIFNNPVEHSEYEMFQWTELVKAKSEDLVKNIDVMIGASLLGSKMDQGESEIIRGLYTPKLILDQFNVLYQTRSIIPTNLDASLRLAEVVAGGESLYRAFMFADKLPLFLKAIRLSALACLKRGDCPWSSEPGKRVK